MALFSRGFGKAEKKFLKKCKMRGKKAITQTNRASAAELLKPHPSPEIEIIYPPGPTQHWTRHHCWKGVAEGIQRELMSWGAGEGEKVWWWREPGQEWGFAKRRHWMGSITKLPPCLMLLLVPSSLSWFCLFVQNGTENFKQTLPSP